MRSTETDVGNSGVSPTPLLERTTQRGRMLAGMAQTVSRRGYAVTPVADVLKVAGVSRKTFYEQFADKQDCFLAAYDAIVALCTDRFVTAYHGGDGWEDGLACAYDALLRTLAAEPDFAHLGIVEVLAAGPPALVRREAAMRRFARFLDVACERVARAPSPPRLVGRAIVGGIHELVYAQIVRGEAAQLPRLTDELLDYTFLLVGAPRATS